MRRVKQMSFVELLRELLDVHAKDILRYQSKQQRSRKNERRERTILLEIISRQEAFTIEASDIDWILGL